MLFTHRDGGARVRDALPGADEAHMSDRRRDESARGLRARAAARDSAARRRHSLGGGDADRRDHVSRGARLRAGEPITCSRASRPALRTVGGVIAGVARGDSASIIQLGVLLLIATPGRARVHLGDRLRPRARLDVRRAARCWCWRCWCTAWRTAGSRRDARASARTPPSAARTPRAPATSRSTFLPRR